MYAGIDLHANNNYLGVVDATGKRIFKKKLPNDPEVILGTLDSLKDRLVGAVVESTFNWYWLVDLLMDEGYRVHLANPSAIQKYKGLKHSDDVHDAFWLAEMLRLDILPTGYIYPKEERGIRDLLRKRGHLVKLRQCWKPIDLYGRVEIRLPEISVISVCIEDKGYGATVDILKVLAILERLLLALCGMFGGLLGLDHGPRFAVDDEGVIGKAMAFIWISGVGGGRLTCRLDVDIQFLDDLRRVIYIPTSQRKVGVNEFYAGLLFSFHKALSSLWFRKPSPTIFRPAVILSA